jgi:hypothetical protein
MLPVGVKVAVLSMYPTVPGTEVPPETTVNVAPVSVVLSIASENVTVTGEVTATPVAPDIGDTDRTVGTVTSALIWMVNEAVPPVRIVVACPR